MKILDGGCALMASRAGRPPTEAALLLWVMGSAALVARPVWAYLINSGALPVPGHEVFPGGQQRIHLTAPTPSSDDSPILRPPPAEPPRDFYSYAGSPSRRVALISSRWANGIRRDFCASIESPRCKVLSRWRRVLWLPARSTSELPANLLNPDPTEQGGALWMALCAARQGDAVANDYEKE